MNLVFEKFKDRQFANNSSVSNHCIFRSVSMSLYRSILFFPDTNTVRIVVSYVNNIDLLLI